MFLNNNLCVLNFAPVDPVITYAGVPAPMVNSAVSCTHVPSVLNVIIGGGLAENLLTQGTVSLGDQAGLGVASGINSGPDRPITSSLKVFMGAIPATRLTSLNIQNLSNTVGMSSTPGQVRVLVLS